MIYTGALKVVTVSTAKAPASKKSKKLLRIKLSSKYLGASVLIYIKIKSITSNNKT